MTDSNSPPVTTARLQPGMEHEWDQLVGSAANGHVMARTGYFHYHASRFEDHSLVFKRGSRWLAVLPANLSAPHTLTSHQGTSFGGLILAKRARYADVRDVFAALTQQLREDGITRLLYRPAPHPYHPTPREDDLYCLLSAGARIVDTKLHAMVRCEDGGDLRSRRWRRNLKPAADAGVRISSGESLETFWPHVLETLATHEQKPVHSLADVLLLHSRLPGAFRFLEARAADGTFLAGHLFLLSGPVLNSFYLGETEAGRALGANRYLLDHVLAASEFAGRWLDMGQWTDTDTREESASLLEFKESAGARLIQRNTWELSIS